jgi:DNA-binding GntR family transcriptional regulator
MEPGEKLSREEDLVKIFGVSLITIRKALSNLEKEGLIVRNRAIGTYVAENIKITNKFVITNEVYNILQDANRYEVKGVSLHTIKIKEARQAREVREFFKVTNEDRICLIKRTRLFNGKPMYYLENYLPEHIATHLSAKELKEKHLLTILKDKINLVIDHGVMYLEAIPADVDLSEILNTQIFEPLILRQLRYWTPDGKPLEIVDSFMRPDYFKYKVNISGTSF